MTQPPRRLWWLAPAVLFGCWIGFWYAERTIFPDGDEMIATGAIWGLVIGIVAAMLIERYLRRHGK